MPHFYGNAPSLFIHTVRFFFLKKEETSETSIFQVQSPTCISFFTTMGPTTCLLKNLAELMKSCRHSASCRGGMVSGEWTGPFVCKLLVAMHMAFVSVNTQKFCAHLIILFETTHMPLPSGLASASLSNTNTKLWKFKSVDFLVL
jgi:hypothetical protein